ncbi:HrpJ domain-containing protein [Variovorax sp. RHLX14]|uniref:HrpJ domain-containing protein n=1 Tax=Variovorax sp. RHLX14 TaxID=1259731 RepID=UPI003F4494CC
MPTAPTASASTQNDADQVKTPVFRRPDPSRQTRTRAEGGNLQGMLAQIAARPSQLRRVVKSLGDDKTDPQALSDEASAHVKGGGTLSGFADTHALDPATLQLIGNRAALDLSGSDPALAQVLQRELEHLQDILATDIGAALNTAAALAAGGRSQLDKAWLRNMYMSVTSASAPVLDAYESLLQRFGTLHFEAGAIAMMRALADDMNAPRASIPPDKLQILLLSSMVTIRHIVALIQTCNAFLRRPKTVPGPAAEETQKDSDKNSGDRDESRGELATVRMIKLLLQLTTSSAAVKLVPGFLEEDVVSKAHAERAARARNEFIDVMRNLPATLWKDPKLKDQLIEMLRRQAILEPDAGMGPRA